MISNSWGVNSKKLWFSYPVAKKHSLSLVRPNFHSITSCHELHFGALHPHQWDFHTSWKYRQKPWLSPFNPQGKKIYYNCHTLSSKGNIFTHYPSSFSQQPNREKKKLGFFNCLVFFNGQSSEELLVVVGGGAAGVFGAIRAKTLAPNLKVVVIEKGKPLSKVCV